MEVMDSVIGFDASPGAMKQLEVFVETVILASRWLLVVFYIGLALALAHGLNKVPPSPRFIDGVAARIDDAALREAQARKDAVAAYELVSAALGA